VNQAESAFPIKYTVKVYVYSKNLKNLLITFPSITSLVKILNCDKDVVSRYIKSENFYLESFVFRNEPLPNISLKEFCSSESDFVELLNKAIMASPDINAKRVYVYSQEKKQLLITFPSILKLAKILNISSTYIINYIKSEKTYLNSFVFRYKPLPNISLKNHC
jgi:hypothetical protein